MWSSNQKNEWRKALSILWSSEDILFSLILFWVFPILPCTWFPGNITLKSYLNSCDTVTISTSHRSSGVGNIWYWILPSSVTSGELPSLSEPGSLHRKRDHNVVVSIQWDHERYVLGVLKVPHGCPCRVPHYSFKGGINIGHPIYWENNNLKKKTDLCFSLKEALDELRPGCRSPDFRPGASGLDHSSRRRELPPLSSFSVYEWIRIPERKLLVQTDLRREKGCQELETQGGGEITLSTPIHIWKHQFICACLSYR